MSRNPAWTRQEIILALDLYFEIDRSEISSRHPKIVALSEALNRLKAAEQLDFEKFRNANGTALKLHNLSRLDPAVQSKGMSHGGKLEEQVWNEFHSDKPALRLAAEAIRGSIAQ